MRNVLFLVVIVSAVMLSACKKGSNCCAPPSPLTGSWELIKTLMSPGPMGNWEKYEGPSKFVSFDGKEKVIATGNVLWGNFNHYQVVDDKNIAFSNTITGESVNYRYELARDSLTIYFNCFEPCGARFTKVYLTDPF